MFAWLLLIVKAYYCRMVSLYPRLFENLAKCQKLVIDDLRRTAVLILDMPKNFVKAVVFMCREPVWKWGYAALQLLWGAIDDRVFVRLLAKIVMPVYRVVRWVVTNIATWWVTKAESHLPEFVFSPLNTFVTWVNQLPEAFKWSYTVQLHIRQQNRQRRKEKVDAFYAWTLRWKTLKDSEKFPTLVALFLGTLPGQILTDIWMWLLEAKYLFVEHYRGQLLRDHPEKQSKYLRKLNQIIDSIYMVYRRVINVIVRVYRVIDRGCDDLVDWMYNDYPALWAFPLWAACWGIFTLVFGILNFFVTFVHATFMTIHEVWTFVRRKRIFDRPISAVVREMAQETADQTEGKKTHEQIIIILKFFARLTGLKYCFTFVRCGWIILADETREVFMLWRSVDDFKKQTYLARVVNFFIRLNTPLVNCLKFVACKVFAIVKPKLRIALLIVWDHAVRYAKLLPGACIQLFITSTNCILALILFTIEELRILITALWGDAVWVCVGFRNGCKWTWFTSKDLYLAYCDGGYLAVKKEIIYRFKTWVLCLGQRLIDFIKTLLPNSYDEFYTLVEEFPIKVVAFVYGMCVADLTLFSQFFRKYLPTRITTSWDAFSTAYETEISLWFRRLGAVRDYFIELFLETYKLAFNIVHYFLVFAIEFFIESACSAAALIYRTYHRTWEERIQSLVNWLVFSIPLQAWPFNTTDPYSELVKFANHCRVVYTPKLLQLWEQLVLKVRKLCLWFWNSTNAISFVVLILCLALFKFVVIDYVGVTVGIDYYISIFHLLLVTGLLVLFVLQQQNYSGFSKVKLLTIQLVLLGLVFLQTKNEQYLPIYLLVEFGTVTFLYSLYKNIGHSVKTTTTPLVIYATLVIFVFSLVTAGKSTYWVDIYQEYLKTGVTSSDFDALKIMIVVTSAQILVPMFIFILVITLVIIGINGIGNRTGFITQKQAQVELGATNKFDESGSKKVDPTLGTFKK